MFLLANATLHEVKFVADKKLFGGTSAIGIKVLLKAADSQIFFVVLSIELVCETFSAYCMTWKLDFPGRAVRKLGP